MWALIGNYFFVFMPIIIFIIIHRHSLHLQYAPAMLIVFCIQLAGSITSYTYRYHFDETLNQNLNRTLALCNGTLNGNGTEATPAARLDWALLQAEVRCVLTSIALIFVLMHSAAR